MPSPQKSDGNGAAATSKVSPRTRRAARRRRVRQRTISVLPTMFTLANLLAGFAAVFLASRPSGTPMPFNWTPLTFAALAVFFGMVCDALDGRVARMTRSTSDLGAQLDSMADMVTFGVAPAMILVQIVQVQAPYLTETGDTLFDRLALAIAFIYVACAGLRLARFNAELDNAPAGKHLYFRGLPSPGAGGTVAGLALLHQHFWANEAATTATDLAAYALLAITLLCALGMVSRLKYTHIMNRYVRGRAPFGTVVLAVVVLLLLLVWPQLAIAGGFAAYALSGPLHWCWALARRKAIV